MCVVCPHGAITIVVFFCVRIALVCFLPRGTNLNAKIENNNIYPQFNIVGVQKNTQRERWQSGNDGARGSINNAHKKVNCKLPLIRLNEMNKLN